MGNVQDIRPVRVRCTVLYPAACRNVQDFRPVKLQALFYILWSSKRAPVPLTFKEAKGKLISGMLGVEPLSLALKTGLYTS